MSTFLSDLLAAMRVKHTRMYSDKRFREMPFSSMFGVSHLLKEYGVDSVGVKVEEKARGEALRLLPVPFAVDTLNGFLIVTRVADGTVQYISQGKRFNAPEEEIITAWNGIALLTAATDEAKEPGYLEHSIAEGAERMKRWALAALITALLGIGMWLSGLYSSWAAWVVLALDVVGIALSWMLVQKALGIHTKAADSVCSVLEEGGCDEIARSEAASFMGIFKWSEVGLSYFSVSLMALILFPKSLPVLAAINILCLPYTIWSISYQRFIAKTWCTLCVFVQIVLWLLFAFYLAGGWTASIVFNGCFWWTFGILAAVYVVVLLILNLLDTALLKYFNNRQDVKS